MLDLKRLRVLKEVVERGSFSLAAEALSYTQSAVSQQIAALERDVGATLLERNARGLRLTDAGHALLDHSDQIFASVSAAEAELEAIAGLRAGRLRLATFPTAGAALVPLAVGIFRRSHPEVELSLIESEPEESVLRLRAREIDVGIVFDYPREPSPIFEELYAELELVPLLDDPLYLVLPADHPLADEPGLRPEHLAEESWVMNDDTGPCWRLHLAACRAAGFEPRADFRSDDFNVVQGLVAAGAGVSLVPELALTNPRDDIAIRSLGDDAPTRRIYAATVERGYRSAATEAMLDVLREAGESYRRRAPELATA